MLWARHRAPESPSWPCFPGTDPHKIPIDPNGNLASKTEGTDTWGYSWNAENQLTKVEKNGLEQARFSYDPLGRRVEKIAGGVTTGYTYDGFDILRETRGSIALKYVHGPQVDEPLAVDDGAALSYLHADGLGSIVKTTNATGAVAMTRQYDAWGHLQIGGDQPGYAFTGREWDPEVGLYHYRTRYYEPKLGRFILEDLIGFDGGENFYAYVTNAPANSGDPFGFCGLGGCGAKMSRGRPDPTPPPEPTCIAPSDYPCPCPLQARYDDDKYWACMASGGAAGGGPSGGFGTHNFGNKSKKAYKSGGGWGQKSEQGGIARRQGASACAVGGLVMLMQIPQICRRASLECVPIGSTK